MTWYHANAPFGGVVFTVNADGGLGQVQPGRGVIANTGHGSETNPTVPDRTGEHTPDAAVWTFNGKTYTQYVTVELATQPWNLGTPSVSFNAWGNEYTPSAKRQIQEWITAHYSELAQPRRIAFARWANAVTAARYAAEDLAKAQTADRIARDEVDAAAANLHAYDTYAKDGPTGALPGDR